MGEIWGEGQKKQKADDQEQCDCAGGHVLSKSID